ncbi:hypothetical protein [Metabacillus sp. Hm71]|uniref:hypothetical protein n=1 Tax=Metabacillus sp. Hm71 TaxID=3450743 RepID=UPI003F42F7C1
MGLRYTFEKITYDDGYQVRLKGLFVTYVSEKDPKIVDGILKENGWESRQEFFDYHTK